MKNSAATENADIAPEYGSIHKFLQDHAFPLHAHEEGNGANEGAWSCHVHLYNLLLHTLSYQASHCHNIYHSIAHAKHLTTTVQTQTATTKTLYHTPDATTNYQLQPVFLQCSFSYSQLTRQAARRIKTTREGQTDNRQTQWEALPERLATRTTSSPTQRCPLSTPPTPAQQQSTTSPVHGTRYTPQAHSYTTANTLTSTSHTK